MGQPLRDTDDPDHIFIAELADSAGKNVKNLEHDPHKGIASIAGIATCLVSALNVGGPDAEVKEAVDKLAFLCWKHWPSGDARLHLKPLCSERWRRSGGSEPRLSGVPMTSSLYADLAILMMCRNKPSSLSLPVVECKMRIRGGILDHAVNGGLSASWRICVAPGWPWRTTCTGHLQ